MVGITLNNVLSTKLPQQKTLFYLTLRGRYQIGVSEMLDLLDMWMIEV